MKSIETSIIIESSPEVVWAVLMDFTSYAEWNPFITSISGTPAINQQIEVRLTLENEKPTTFKPKVVELKTNRLFCWQGHLFVKGLFDGKHRFEVIPLEDGTVKFVQSETFSGLLVGAVLKLVGEKTIAGFNAMNSALKYIVEENKSIKKAS